MRVQTEPPVPPFIHCAQLSLQPPENEPPQLSSSDAASVQVPVVGLPNCWMTGAGPGLDDVDDVELLVNPPPVAAHVAIIVMGLGVNDMLSSVKIVASAEPTSNTSDCGVESGIETPVHALMSMFAPPVRSRQPVVLPLVPSTVTAHGVDMALTPGPEVLMVMTSPGLSTPGRLSDDVAEQLAATTRSTV